MAPRKDPWLGVGLVAVRAIPVLPGTRFHGVSSENAVAYLRGLAVSSRRRHRRRARQVLPFGGQRRPGPARVVRQDSPAHVAPPLRVLVIHVVAGLAEVVLARVASREHVLGAAQGALTGVALGDRGWSLSRELDDLVVGVTTVPRERRRGDLRGRWGAIGGPLLLLRFSLLLLRLRD